ncbi:MAG TPA: hypothetical protein ENI97_09780 [Gammaproteobacteria bacterium]|nr:hypothetical protein [Gammaproteobacteria bacterium]
MTEPNEPVQALDARTKILGNIVRYLKDYPFLLIAMAGLIVLTIALAFDVEKIKEFKLLLYGVVLAPVVMQFYFEAQKQRHKHLSERRAQEALTREAAPPQQEVSNAKFSRKAIAGLVVSLLVYAEIGDTPDELMYEIAPGSLVMSGITLWLGMSALKDIKKNLSTGKGTAVAVIGLSALMMLGSLAWLVE